MKIHLSYTVEVEPGKVIRVIHTDLAGMHVIENGDGSFTDLYVEDRNGNTAEYKLASMSDIEMTVHTS